MYTKLIASVIVGISMLIGVVSSKFIGKKDNIVEEVAEQIIEEVTGMDIDLSPGTPEKDDEKIFGSLKKKDLISKKLKSKYIIEKKTKKGRK